MRWHESGRIGMEHVPRYAFAHLRGGPLDGDLVETPLDQSRIPAKLASRQVRRRRLAVHGGAMSSGIPRTGMIEKIRRMAWTVVAATRDGLTGPTDPSRRRISQGHGYDRAEEEAKGVAQRCAPSQSVRFTPPTVL
jgi:hypothetical protein